MPSASAGATYLRTVFGSTPKLADSTSLAGEEHRNGNWRQRRSCDGAGRKPDAAWRPTGPIARVAADAETSHLMRQRLQPGRIRSGPAFTLASVLVVGSGSGRDYRTTYSRILPRTCGRGSPTRMLRVGRRLAISASFRGAVTGLSQTQPPARKP